MANTKRLGEIQRIVLGSMYDRKEAWTPGCGWNWDTYSGTVRIMEGLRRRGLMDNTGQPAGSRKEEYRLTPEGQRWVELDRTPTLPESDRNIIIVMMAEMDLSWSPTEGWHYKTVQYTELGMKDLEKQGLVRQVGEKRERHYVAGHKLLELAKTLGYDPNLIDGV